MNNEDKCLFKLSECKEAQRKYDLCPCQLAVLLRLVEHPPKDKNHPTIVGANCKLSNFTFEWCKNLMYSSKSVDAYVDGLKQGCLKCPYNNYNYCDYVLMHLSKPLCFNEFKCSMCHAVVPFDAAIIATYCPECGRKIRNKELLGKV